MRALAGSAAVGRRAPPRRPTGQHQQALACRHGPLLLVVAVAACHQDLGAGGARRTKHGRAVQSPS